MKSAPENASKLVFKPQANLPKDSFVMVFDLEGFSRFFSQPDVQEYVTVFLNKVFQAVSLAIYGGTSFWNEGENEKTLTPFIPPAHVKFLGDGALYIWTFNRGEKEKHKRKILFFINRLWNIKLDFPKIVASCVDSVPVVDLPGRIRFGFAAGSAYKISYKYQARDEYIGYSINLASRLQNYCKELGFIASARVAFTKEILEEHRYRKVVATSLSGFPNEVVLVDKQEFEALDATRRSELFKEIA